MKYELSIKDYNKQAHIDIEKDIGNRENGLFTFTLRVNKSCIVDYNVVEYVNAKEKYLSLKRVVIQEFTLAHNSRKRSQPNPFWSNYFQRGTKERGSDDRHAKHSKKQKNKV